MKLSSAEIRAMGGRPDYEMTRRRWRLMLEVVFAGLGTVAFLGFWVAVILHYYF